MTHNTGAAQFRKQRETLLSNARNAKVPLATCNDLARIMDECEGWGARYAQVSRDEIPAESFVAFRLGMISASDMQEQHAATADELIELIRAADEEREAHWRAVGRSLSGRSA